MGAPGHRDRDCLNRAALLVLAAVLPLTACAGGPREAGPGRPPAVTAAVTAAAVTVSPRPLAPPPRPARRPVARPGSEPVFTWSARRVTAAGLGRSWRRGCPVAPSRLRAVTVAYWGFDGEPHTGVLILHADVVTRTRPVFATLFEKRFPIRRIRPVSRYGGSDDASMAADNTSAFNCRRAVAAGPPSWSRHAYGRAIDVNPVENPYLFGRRVLPPGGKAFTDRSRARPGLIRRADPVQRAFRRAGYRWGGEFSNPDYQHFDR